MQNSAIEAMEQSDNPAYGEQLALREKIDARLQSARQDWRTMGRGTPAIPGRN